MEILCINLRRSADRRQFQERQAEVLGLNLRFLDATGYRNLSVSELANAARHWTRSIVGKDVGCFQSHRRAWEVVARMHSPCVILEDDIVFTKNIAAILRELETVQFPDNRVYDLEFEPRKHLIAKRAIWKGNGFYASQLFINKTGAGCYVLTPYVARRLLSEVGVYAMVDSWLWTGPWLQMVQIEPCPAAQSRDLQQNYAFDTATTQANDTYLLTGTLLSRKLLRASPTADQLFNFCWGVIVGENRRLKLNRGDF
ncbi:glycosyltransferase family 25 protein [Shewanella sp.]|uniref:glycosyltransferase family 25 protein n=1 Tax=Shewanella sp. TaxID=50422 RepID=UPI0040480EAE